MNRQVEFIERLFVLSGYKLRVELGVVSLEDEAALETIKKLEYDMYMTSTLLIDNLTREVSVVVKLK